MDPFTYTKFPEMDPFHRFLVKHGRYSVIPDRNKIKEYLRRYYLLRPDSSHRKTTDIAFNPFLHQFMSSDDPVYHDHPWNWFASIIIKGGYWEHTPWGTHWRSPGHYRYQNCLEQRNFGYDDNGNAIDLPANLHWVEVPKSGKTWTLFIRGRTDHNWGFVPTPENGKWIDHDTYLKSVAKK